MKITVLSTGTNNVPPIINPLEDLGHALTWLYYDSMTHEEIDSDLFDLTAESKPDLVVYVGALSEHHGKPVPHVSTLAKIGAKHLMVHVCFDGAEHYWFHRLQQYYDKGRFALQVNIDGVRTGPIGDRGLTLLCPVDVYDYDCVPHKQRPIQCGFSGGLHAGRPEFIFPLAQRGALVYRPRNEQDEHANYRSFLAMCRVGFNHATTGGIIGGLHIKARVLECAASGCLVLESKGSPLSNWFVPDEDYLEYDSVDDAEAKIKWTRDNPGQTERMALQLREKIKQDHSPKVFWSQVFERLGFGPPIRLPKELTWQHWLMPTPDQLPMTVMVHEDGEDQPMLVESSIIYNLVGYRGRVFAIPKSLGQVNLENRDIRIHPHVKVFSTLAEAKQTLAL